MPASISESTRALRAHESPIPSTMSMTGRMSIDGDELRNGGSAGTERGMSLEADRRVSDANSYEIGEKSASTDWTSSAASKGKSVSRVCPPASMQLPAPALTIENLDPGKLASASRESSSLPRDVEKRAASMEATSIPPRSSAGREHARAGSGSFIPPHVRSPTHISVGTEVDEDDEEVGARYEAQLGLILIHLSLPSPIISLICAVYTIIASLLLLLTSPLSVCTTLPPFPHRLSTALLPALTFQLNLLLSDLSPTLSEQPHSPFRALLSSLFAPLISLPIMLAAWVVGVFWLFALAVGIPGQKRADVEQGTLRIAPLKKRKDSEGRMAARAVRRWWEGWLGWGISEA